MVQVWVNDMEAGRLAPPDPRDRKPRTAYKPQVIQRRMGHESITTTVDTYGHLLDALDDGVVAAVEWAMDLTAPLPGFLEQSGLASATGGLPGDPASPLARLRRHGRTPATRRCPDPNARAAVRVCTEALKSVRKTLIWTPWAPAHDAGPART
ncbi:hypothetical protein ACFW1M_00080 [Streptomyces inhibens]|uniref:hypothetical protein n=1 Tax=Streptomyces inhibens TaxID=2293571 RepID=UPI00369D11AE